MNHHIQLIHQLVAEVFNGGNLALTEALYASTVRINGELFSAADLQDAQMLLHTVRPGREVTIEPVSVLDDLVLTSWTVHRTNIDPRDGADRAARSSSWTGLRLFRIVEGRITEVWFNAAARQHLETVCQ